MKGLIVLHRGPEIDVEIATAGIPHKDETPFGCQRGKGTLQGRPHGVDYKISPLAIGQPTDFTNNILLKSINDMGSAKLAQTRLSFATAGSRNNRRPRLTRELNGCQTDAASGGLDQNCFAFI
jgi:hypothetical protein